MFSRFPSRKIIFYHVYNKHKPDVHTTASFDLFDVFRIFTWISLPAGLALFKISHHGIAVSNAGVTQFAVTLVSAPMVVGSVLALRVRGF